METHKSCNSCGLTKPQKDFPINYKYKKGSNRSKRESICKTCRNKAKNKFFSKSPENYLKNLFNHLKNKRGKKQGLNINITHEELVDIYHKQKGLCAISGVIMTHIKDGTIKGFKGHSKNISLDRINPSGDYDKNNIQLVCFRVNLMKHSLNEDDLLSWIKAIYEFKNIDKYIKLRQ
tara:strand:- start:435 stop:965 length:531 start_codon:yes stop_codon:yes gene_type:complete